MSGQFLAIQTKTNKHTNKTKQKTLERAICHSRMEMRLNQYAAYSMFYMNNAWVLLSQENQFQEHSSFSKHKE